MIYLTRIHRSQIGMMDCDQNEYPDISHVRNLGPMKWDVAISDDQSFSAKRDTPWLAECPNPAKTSLVGAIRAMAKLRSETASIYINAVIKNNEMNGNCGIR